MPSGGGERRKTNSQRRGERSDGDPRGREGLVYLRGGKEKVAINSTLGASRGIMDTILGSKNEKRR